MHATSIEQLVWERTVPHAVTSDVIWKLDVYRMSLFLRHLSLATAARLERFGLKAKS